ncbi:MAG: hypothetical protein WA194_09690 [Patescibacteria group bacterium]
MEDLGELAGAAFPFSTYENGHGELVRKTRHALYGTDGFVVSDYDSFLAEWKGVLKRKE